MRSTLPEGHSQYADTTESGVHVCLNTSPQGQEDIQRDLQVLKEELNGLQATANEAEAKLGQFINIIITLNVEGAEF